VTELSGRPVTGAARPRYFLATPPFGATMRKFLLTAAVLFAASSASAQGDPPKTDSTAKKTEATHVGSWRGSVSTEQGNQEVWLTVKKDAEGKHSGVAGSQMGETPLYDVTVKGDTLSAGATVQTPNGNFDIWYTLLLKQDTLGGSIDLNIQGQKM